VLDLDASLAHPDAGGLAELRRRLQAEPQLGIGVTSGRASRSPQGPLPDHHGQRSNRGCGSRTRLSRDPSR